MKVAEMVQRVSLCSPNFHILHNLGTFVKISEFLKIDQSFCFSNFQGPKAKKVGRNYFLKIVL